MSRLMKGDVGWEGTDTYACWIAHSSDYRVPAQFLSKHSQLARVRRKLAGLHTIISPRVSNLVSILEVVLQSRFPR